MEKYEVILYNIESKGEISVQINVDESESSENIIIHALINGKEFSSSDAYYFTAFQEFRDELLESGFGIKCNGAQLNAIQSGMFSTTDKVYLVVPEKPALMKDLVCIWDYANITAFPNTEQQNAYSEQWMKRYSCHK